MIRTQIQLTKEQMKALKNISSSKGIPVAELIRNCVDELIHSPQMIDKEEQKRKALSVIGKYRSQDQPANVAENHDDYLADIYLS